MNSNDWTPSILPFPKVKSVEDIIRAIKDDILIADAMALPYAPALFPFQRMTMRALSDHQFIWIQMPRGTSKSWIVGRYLTVESWRNKMLAVYTAPTFRQGLNLWNYADTFMAENKEQSDPTSWLYEIKSRTTERMKAVIELMNESKHIALPMGQGKRIRGERADVLACDEFFEWDRETYQKHVLPFLHGQKDAESVGPKCILMTSAEYQDCFAYSVLTEFFIPKVLEEDDLVAADPSYKRKFCIIDLNIDDVAADGYSVDWDVIEQQLSGAGEVERQQALYNKWIGISGQFFPPNLTSKMASEKVTIQHEADGVSDYCFAIDVATAIGGDQFVLDVLQMMPEHKAAGIVNSFWAQGMTADEIAWKIHCFNRKFHPTWIVMDKGGGGLQVQHSLMKKTLEMRDGTVHTVEFPIVEWNDEYMDGEHKLVLNRPSDTKVREGFVTDRSSTGEFIHSEDILIHLTYNGMKGLLSQDEMKLLIPASYDDNEGGEDNSNAVIFENIYESVRQLRHLTIKTVTLQDGRQEIVRTKVSRVPNYVWKTTKKDGASALSYAYIAYCIYYRERRNLDMAAPIIRPTISNGPEGMVPYSEGQLEFQRI